MWTVIIGFPGYGRSPHTFGEDEDYGGTIKKRQSKVLCAC